MAVVEPGGIVTSLATGRDGALLVGAEGYIERRRGDIIDRIAFPTGLTQLAPGGNFGVRLLHDDGAALWASFTYDALYRYADGQWRRSTDFGLPAYAPNAMTQGRNGELWIGYRDDEAFLLKEGKAKRYGATDGLDTGVIGALYDDGGILLAGGDRGLALFDGRRFHMVSAADPQAFTGITGIMRTPDGDLWVNGSRGLVHIAAAAWDALRRTTLQGGATSMNPLACEVFDTLDGYPGNSQFRAGQSSLVLDHQGRIWLNGSTGVARIDPARLYRNRIPPPMQIRALETGNRTYATRNPVTLPPGTTELQIAYAAATYTMPERVHFRYRLDGVDADWRDAGSRRMAFYTRLEPGTYHFLVEATNEDGIRSVQPAGATFRIAPTFIQSAPFKVMCAVLVLMLGYALYRLRLRYATMQLRRLLRERVDERERIARMLHDTLMQSVQALLMLFERAYEKLPAGDPERSLLGRTLALARATVTEGRDELSALRSAAGAAQDLAAALAPLGNLLSEQYGVTFATRVDGIPRALRPEVAFEIIFIAREAMQNAFRHAGATTIALELDYAATTFTLRVRDDGRGMTDQAAAPGHWGLAGMRERAAVMKARLDMVPATPSGTVVTLILDGPAAFQSESGTRRH